MTPVESTHGNPSHAYASPFRNLRPAPADPQRHDETDSQLYVSHNDDPLCAVWIRKQPLLIDPRFSGRFVVIALTDGMAREKQLAAMPILDFDRYLPEERKQLQAAIDAAYRARQRHRGVQQSSMGYMGRNSYA